MREDTGGVQHADMSGYDIIKLLHVRTVIKPLLRERNHTYVLGLRYVYRPILLPFPPNPKEKQNYSRAKIHHIILHSPPLPKQIPPCTRRNPSQPYFHLAQPEANINNSTTGSPLYVIVYQYSTMSCSTFSSGQETTERYYQHDNPRTTRAKR